ncbi:MAG: hypothetical protein QM736_11145 [Vicinamibacterales bacterium]
MKAYRFAVGTMATVIVAGMWVGVGNGQQQVAPSPQLPGAPLTSQGEAVFAAIEGWGPHKDGSTTIEVGYYNRNRDQTLDIPVGPNNRIEPGGPDMGQPTHFEPGRHYGVFALTVPKDFGNKKLTWTIVANGHTSSVQLGTAGPYWVDFFLNPSTGNTPPVIRFAPNGAENVGPPPKIAETRTATVGQAVPLSVWVSDKPSTYDPEEGLPENQRTRGRGRGAAPEPAPAARAAAPPPPNFDVSAARGSGQPRGNFGRGNGPQPDVTLTWKIHRGTASDVSFSEPVIRLFNKGDINAVMEAKTDVTFKAPGEYVLRAQANDQTGDGGGGDLCCWTNALVKYVVK